MFTALISVQGIILTGIFFAGLITLALIGANVVINKNGVSLSKGKVKKLSPHATCPHRVSAVNALRRTLEYAEKISDMKYQVLEDQMAFYEEKEEEVIIAYKDIFAELIQHQFPESESYATTQEYKDYELVLASVFDSVKQSVRKWFRNNHYAKQDLEEQTAYIKTKKEILIKRVIEDFDKKWSGKTVTRSELKEANMKYLPDWEDAIVLVFNRAFTIARDYATRRANLEAQYRLFVKETFGDDVVVLEED